MTAAHGPDTGRAASTPPSEVPGFAAAGAAGLLPVVPRRPPSLVPGPTALHALHRYLWRAGGLAVAWAAGLALLSAFDGGWVVVTRLGWMAVTVVGFLVVVRRLSSDVGEPYLRELAAGYTTLKLDWGTLWNARPVGQTITYRQRWDYRGLWVLDGEGRVREEPRPGAVPPGFYPSPHDERLELWTGEVWAGVFRPTTDQAYRDGAVPPEGRDGRRITVEYGRSARPGRRDSR